MKTIPHDANQRVVEFVEDSIDELHMLTLSRGNAIRLLLIQSAIRMPDAAAIREALGDTLED